MNSMSDLTDKQVINMCDGKILGYVSDFIVDNCTGKLKAIILPGEGGLFKIKKCKDIVIPWDRIYRIGIDTILVEINVDDCCSNSSGEGRR